MQPGTSSMIQGLAACFTGLEDPRETSRCDHQLIDILVIAVCAVIACAESWEDIALYGRSKQAWLETFLALPNGTGIGVERRHGIDPGEQGRSRATLHRRDGAPQGQGPSRRSLPGRL